MDLADFLSLMRRRWFVVLAVGLAGVAVGVVYTLVATPKYVAVAELLVSTTGGTSTADLAQGSEYAQQQAANYALVATKEVVLDPVIHSQHLDMTVDELSREVSASASLDSSLVSVSVEDSSPSRSAAIANAVTDSLAELVGELGPTGRDAGVDVRLTTVQRATTPVLPSSPKVNLIGGTGFIVGIIAGLAFVVLKEMMGAKIRSPEQINQLFDLPVLGSIGFDRRALSSPVLVDEKSWSMRGEAFRKLRTNLRFLRAGSANNVFVVTSSVPGEGKTSTCVNLAQTLAASGRSVVLVECDLRKPSLGQYLDQEDSVGLTTILADDRSLESSLQEWVAGGFSVLFAGEVPPNPSELLDSDATQMVLEELQDSFDVVLIDTPPVLSVTDATVLAGRYGGAILVTACGRVGVRDLGTAVETLRMSGTHVLGVVANFTSVPRRDRYRSAYSSQAVPVKQNHGVSDPDANGARRGRTRGMVEQGLAD